MIRRLVPAIALCTLASACGGSSPAGPSTTAGYGGEWIGTTAQGAPISFTISPDEKVTSITIGYNFNSCSGSQTFSNLSLDIAPNVTCFPAPCPVSLASYRTITYMSPPAGDQFTTINGLFQTASTAQGIINFNLIPGCGSAFSVPWTARKR